MHICYVTTTFPPDNGWGGIGTYVWNIARGMRDLGHRVTVLCAGGQKGCYEIESEGINVARVLDDSPTAVPIRQQVGSQLSRLIRERQIDVVEVSEYSAIGLDFQRANPSFPVVVRFHGSSMHCAAAAPRWRRLASTYITRRLAKADREELESTALTHAVTSCSAWAVDKYRRSGWQWNAGTTVVPNPIQSEAPRRAFGSNGVTPILYFGRLDRLKGADLIPVVAGHVWREHPQAEFHCIGQDSSVGCRGGWRRWIEARIPEAKRNQVRFLGGIPHEDVPARLADYRLAFFASIHEMLPYSHLECMRAGLACVVASGGGAGELGEPGRDLLKVARQPQEIGDRLSSMLGNPSERDRIGIAAIERVRVAFDTKLVSLQTERVYRAVIA